jgi:glycerophosphoryl diester phosphodiesterase
MAMTLKTSKMIGVAAVSHDGTTLNLHLLDDLIWTENDMEHVLLLQEKINSYLAYIESDEVYEKFPQARGKKFLIRVDTKYPPTSEAGLHFLAKAKPFLQNANVDLEHTYLSFKQD